MKAKGLDPEKYTTYIETFRYGAPPHASRIRQRQKDISLSKRLRQINTVIIAEALDERLAEYHLINFTVPYILYQSRILYMV
ncbi:hypothetical protein ADUPG1_007478 [Aduncisulcus paluster]|uniref:Uncharacterized protein n=1 Tax=Aduncisulcus paluster TaxID=2918883 RepID=A0ABQ5KMF6_9EUKA|nr:hypothetical protein ADUPG1_007478 [Aduncisulcus paluster]